MFPTPARFGGRMLKIGLILLGCVGFAGCVASPMSYSVSAASGPQKATGTSTAAPLPLTPATVKPAATKIPVIELRGSPPELGKAYGDAVGDTVKLLYENYLMVRLTGPNLLRARVAAAEFEIYFLPEHREELSAMSQSLEINHYDAVLAQCFLDLLPSTGCSTITLPASASPDGIARFGRNLDFPSLNIADKHSVLFIYHPDDGRYQFAAVGWPGMIGVLSGMNEHGLCLSNMEVDRPARVPSAMPYTLLYRTILERCKNVDEAIQLLRNTPRQTANNLMLMDADGNRAVVEIQPDGITVRRGVDNSALISTNHQRGIDADSSGRCWRYDDLHTTSAANFGQIDPNVLEQMLSRVVQGDHGEMTLQSMIFEPSTRVIYLATGTDAPSRTFERIDLKAYFGEPAGALREKGD